jgi:tetratricopeptide (TPR) repeat protein
MVAGSWFNRCGSLDPAHCPSNSKEANQVSSHYIERGRPLASFLVSLFFVFLLASLTVVAQTSREMYIISAQQLRIPAGARTHLKLAQREFSRSNFAGAEKEIDRALQVDSICAPAFSMLALLRLASRNFDEAIEDATRALALDPTETDANLALATAYNSMGEFQKAEAAARQTIRMRPDFWQGRLELAKAFYGQQRLVAALRELDELNKDFPDVHLVRANILMQLNRSEEATIEFSQFLREAPNDPRRGQIERIVNLSGTTTTSPPSHQ